MTQRPKCPTCAGHGAVTVLEPTCCGAISELGYCRADCAVPVAVEIVCPECGGAAHKFTCEVVIA